MTAPHLPDTIEHLATDALVPYARNSRTHSPEQVAQIAASITEFGFTNPVLIDADNTLIAGHGRVLAAQQLGLATVPTIRLAHLSSAQRRAYVIADNKLAENAGWDMATLAREVEDLQADGYDIDLLGFGDDELADLLGTTNKDPDTGVDGSNIDDAPDVLPAPTTQTGDLWLLGQHRVVCGDSTSKQNVQRLMAGGGADMCWTDPPYNVAYETKAGKIDNDDLSDKEFKAFLVAAFQAAFDALKPGAAIYVAHADTEGLNFRSAFSRAGFKLSGCLVWRKNALALGRSDYQWQHEPILYGWKPGAAHRWFGGRKQTTIVEMPSAESPFQLRPDGKFEIQLGNSVMVVDGNATVEDMLTSVILESKPSRSEGHPTMKPVALVERMLRNSAKKANVVLDLFGGSGSTLMAADRLGMCARLSELDPKYVDVIVTRWQQFTGKTATLEATGQTFEQVRQHRLAVTA
jgi:DNA modification methylase